MERIIHLMQTDKLENAPADALRWSKNIFRARAAERKNSMFETILAVLRVDLSPGTAAFGERSGTPSTARQLLFEAGRNSIDLRIDYSENGFKVRGQVLGEGFSGALVKLGEIETRANDLSEFKFSDVPKGVYSLAVQTEEQAIVIGTLEVL